LSQACLQPHASSTSVAAEHIRKQLALLHSRLVKCHGRALPVTSDLYNMRTAVKNSQYSLQTNMLSYHFKWSLLAITSFNLGHWKNGLQATYCMHYMDDAHVGIK